MTELNTERPIENGDESQPIQAETEQSAAGASHDEVTSAEQPQEPVAEAPEGAAETTDPVTTDTAVEGQSHAVAPWPPMPGRAPGKGEPPKGPRRLSRRAGIGIGAALVAGGIIGALIAVAATPDPTTSKAYVSLQALAASQSASIRSQSGTIDNLQSQVDSDSAQAAALSAAQASVQAQASAVASEQAAVQSAQAVVVQNQIGHGVFVVGKDVKAGTYHTTGPDGSNFSGCYYEWKGSTDANAQIIDNNISQGPATATLTDGQVFTTNGCSAWQKIG